MKWPQGSIHSVQQSPVGDLYLVACQQGLCALLWFSEGETSDLKDSILDLPRSDDHPMVQKTCSQLKEYFEGKRTQFELPLVLIGTEFQKQAWSVLQRIPYGKTISYYDQALQLGDAKKARAVGSANGRNHICIVIPCHRVVTRGGHLGGFSGGLDKKKFLLNIENSSSQKSF